MKDCPEQLRVTIPIGTPPIKTISTTLCPNLNADRLDGNEASAFGLVSWEQRCLRGPLEATGTFLTTSDTAYWIYLGYTLAAFIPKNVEMVLRTNAAGTQTAEVCLASGSAGPTKAAVTLTKLVANGTLDDITTGAVKTVRNTSAMATQISAGVHLYAGVRTAMSVTQPVLVGILADFNEGWCLSTASAGALTGTGPWTGSLIAPAITTVAPQLIVTLD